MKTKLFIYSHEAKLSWRALKYRLGIIATPTGVGSLTDKTNDYEPAMPLGSYIETPIRPIYPG